MSNLFSQAQQSRQNATRGPGTTFHAPLTHSIPRLKPLSTASCCSSCGITFRLFRQKYNCHNCGNVTCGRCSDNRAELSKFGYFEPMRICNLCYNYLKIMEMNQSQLVRLPIKTLREYILAYNLPCHNIIEKVDLINVIMAHRPLEECYEVYYRDHYPIARPDTSSYETASDIPPSANYARTETQNNAGYSQSRYQNTVPQPQARFQTQTQPRSQQRQQNYYPQPQKQPPPSSHTEPISLQTIIRDKVDVSKLSVKTIKTILKENCIDYSKMVEKSELIERMEILIKWAKHEMSRNTNEISDDGLCRICCDAQSNCLFMDCGHMCTCLDCGRKLQETKNECPICRETIIKMIRVFRA